MLRFFKTSDSVRPPASWWWTWTCRECPQWLLVLFLYFSPRTMAGVSINYVSRNKHTAEKAPQNEEWWGPLLPCTTIRRAHQTLAIVCVLRTIDIHGASMRNGMYICIYIYIYTYKHILLNRNWKNYWFSKNGKGHDDTFVYVRKSLSPLNTRGRSPC